MDNQQIMLVNILNRMYNDNINQINSLKYMLSNLIENNQSIRNTITQLLNTITHNETSHNNERNNISNNTMNNTMNNIRQPMPIRMSPLRQPYRNNQSLFNILNNSSYNTLITEFLIENQVNNELEPVIIYPSQTQIELATRRIQYSDILNPLNTSCPISLEDFSGNDIVVEIRYCGHIFRPQHITNWFRNNCRCPVCRYDIREYNPRLPNIFQENSNETQQESQQESQQETISSRTRTIDTSNNVQNLTNDELFRIILNSFGRF